MPENELFIGVDPGINTGGIGVLYCESGRPVRAMSVAGEFEEKQKGYDKFVRYSFGCPRWVTGYVDYYWKEFGYPEMYVIIEDFNYIGITTTTAVTMHRIIGSCCHALQEKSSKSDHPFSCFICPPVENSIWEPALGVRGMTRDQREKILPKIIGSDNPVETTTLDGPNEHEIDALMIAQWLRDSVRMLSRTGTRPEDIPAEIRTTRKE